ncbi:Gag protein [Caenorhabditis elegans]|uniref:Gag protein n=1 Tax=Caenorhabditis elegans TaxID=6239 RepID=Q9XV69_CAEEL|nr:Gag protein [Caenorhabditis elegans]CAB04165.2 Gag protein [Caenorhabditis elegans]|eukprot:NP_507749.2 Uncharacterized protein CELE_F21D9.8 [Caenorhabditis elegans]
MLYEPAARASNELEKSQEKALAYAIEEVMAPIIGGLKTDVTKILDNVYNAVTGLTNQWADVQQSMTINNTTESQETSHQAAQAGAQSSSNICQLCAANHDISNCTSYNNWITRRERAEALSMCKHCLTVGVTDDDWHHEGCPKAKDTCSVCANNTNRVGCKYHHEALCTSVKTTRNRRACKNSRKATDRSRNWRGSFSQQHAGTTYFRR